MKHGVDPQIGDGNGIPLKRTSLRFQATAARSVRPLTSSETIVDPVQPDLNNTETTQGNRNVPLHAQMSLRLRTNRGVSRSTEKGKNSCNETDC